MKSKGILSASLLLLMAGVCYGQSNSSEVYVESWTTGAHIREQALTFHLDSSQPEHSALVRDDGAGYYKVILRHFPVGKESYQLEYWVVQLRQVLSERYKKEKLGDNLLTYTGPGPGKHYFPKEDMVGFLYPRESPKNALEKYVDGRFYPVGAKRIVKVQNFYVIIQVNNYKMNEANPKKLDSMDVKVEFRNSYGGGKGCKQAAPANNGLHPTADTTAFKYLQRCGAAGDAGR